MRVHRVGRVVRLKSADGFSLIEMMVIVAIIAALVGIAIPNFLDWNRKYKLKDAVATLHGNFGLARMNAINQNATVTVTVTQTSSASPVTVTFTNANTNATVLSTFTMDSEVSLTDATGASLAGVASPQSVKFNPMGLKLDTGSANNRCVTAAGTAGTACSSSTAQAFNFMNSKGLNYRIVITSTGKASWCYASNCGQ